MRRIRDGKLEKWKNLEFWKNGKMEKWKNFDFYI